MDAEQIQQLIFDLSAREIAENVTRRTLERARYGACKACGFTLDGGWSANYCRACSPCELDLSAALAEQRTGGRE